MHHKDPRGSTGTGHTTETQNSAQTLSCSRFNFFCAAAVELPVDPHKVSLSKFGYLYNMVQSKLWKHSIQLLACELRTLWKKTIFKAF